MRSLNPIRPWQSLSLSLQLPALILRNSECDACGCGGDRVDRYMRKTSKNSRAEFGYNSPTSVCPTVRCPLGFVCALPACISKYLYRLSSQQSVCLSVLLACPAFHFPYPLCSVYFSTLSLRKIKFKQSHKSWQIPLLIPNQVNKAMRRF